MDCSNPECGQAIEQGNIFCTKCGAPGRKEELQREPSIPATPPEKDQIRKTLPGIKRNISRPFHIVIVIILSMIVAGIILPHYSETPNQTTEGIKEGLPIKSATAPSNTAPKKSGGVSNKGLESLKEEATQVCSEYARVFKECYMKSSSGVPPAQAKNDIKSERLDAEIIDMSCREGLIEHGRQGGVSSSELNKMTSSIFSDCFSGYVGAGINKISKVHIKNAYTSAIAYFSDEPKGILTSKKMEVYGYKPLADVSISITNGTIDNLAMSAKHKDGDTTYFINSAGDITEQR